MQQQGPHQQRTATRCGANYLRGVRSPCGDGVRIERAVPVGTGNHTQRSIGGCACVEVQTHPSTELK